MMRNAPAPTEPIASTIIGQVITAAIRADGGSVSARLAVRLAGSASQRRFPYQVMNIIRVM